MEGNHCVTAYRRTGDGCATKISASSERELEVLALLAAGRSNRQIASGLFVALSTVKTHHENIYGELDVRNRTRAVSRARELGVL